MTSTPAAAGDDDSFRADAAGRLAAPEALRHSARDRWWNDARATLGYARGVR
jgi:hypothetical protein